MIDSSAYRLRGHAVRNVEVPVVGNLVYDNLGELVIRKLNEEFKGDPRISYEDLIFKKDQSITHFNVPRALAIAQILKGEGADLNVLSPEQVVRYWGAISERGSTYADTDSVCVYPNSGPNEDLRLKALQLVGRESTEVPLIISGLGVEKTDNEHGFTFTAVDGLKVREAPYLVKDGVISYDQGLDSLVESDEGIRVWTPGDQSGLRRLCRYWNRGLYAWDEDLSSSSSIGRVQLFTTQGVVAPEI